MIGIELCTQLTSLGHQVYAICRKGNDRIKRLPLDNNLKVIYADLQNLSHILGSPIQADVFIHLAWTNTDHEGRNNEALQRLNVDYALEAIRIASLSGCTLFVEAGSQAEYGDAPDLITEETPCYPYVEYGKAKLRVLHEGSELCNSLVLKYLHLRIFSTFGENDRPWTLILSAIDKMLKNEEIELSSCTQNWNFLYVSDCAKQIYRLCNHLINKSDFSFGVYNIASKETRPLKNYIEEMKLLLQSSSILMYGYIHSAKQVSLNPSVAKTERAIGFTNEISFSEAIKIIINRNYNIKI